MRMNPVAQPPEQLPRRRRRELSLVPNEMSVRSRLTGIEIDPLTAAIARQLYPDADIRSQGFETAALDDDSFDLAISNVPFGDYKLHDPSFNEHNFLVHDYFFAKAVENIRPGGAITRQL